jgi:hypothetical protein
VQVWTDVLVSAHQASADKPAESWRAGAWHSLSASRGLPQQPSRLSRRGHRQRSRQCRQKGRENAAAARARGRDGLCFESAGQQSPSPRSCDADIPNHKPRQKPGGCGARSSFARSPVELKDLQAPMFSPQSRAASWRWTAKCLPVLFRTPRPQDRPAGQGRFSHSLCRPCL